MSAPRDPIVRASGGYRMRSSGLIMFLTLSRGRTRFLTGFRHTGNYTSAGRGKAFTAPPLQHRRMAFRYRS
jgi:hypothetical protein